MYGYHDGKVITACKRQMTDNKKGGLSPLLMSNKNNNIDKYQ